MRTDVPAKGRERAGLFAQGFRYGLPIMLGYAPVSFAFAVAAVGSGLPWYLVLAISMSNFTSAGQAAGANLLAAGGPLPEIGVTVTIPYGYTSARAVELASDVYKYYYNELTLDEIKERKAELSSNYVGD